MHDLIFMSMFVLLYFTEFDAMHVIRLPSATKEYNASFEEIVLRAVSALGSPSLFTNFKPRPTYPLVSPNSKLF